MPQINRIRVNNVKYNFGTQVYDDFIMRFNCKNTIYDLANGGGKSLLMLLLLQNVIPNCTLDEKQPIEKLFRAGCDNTVIHSLVEWKLDSCYRKDNFKYMTTGFCARKGHVKEDENAQENAQDTSDNASIEYFNYCIFYRKFGDNDIKNLPLVNDNGERVTYNGLKAYLRELEKKDFNVSVKIFDRKGDYQNFISKYGLFESQWEIIRGINKTEGHVRTYFETNYKTSRKVVEDLLIEEIIQKSFNNRLAVTDDEGKMAQTLLDIKDKLVELSRKNDTINSYNNQISLLNDFAEYIKTFSEMYTKKEDLKVQLYDMFVQSKRLLKVQEDNLQNIEEKIDNTEKLRLDEQRKVQTAQVMTEQSSLKSIEALIKENEKLKADNYKSYKELVEKLKLMESANDYNDYKNYQKALYEAELIVKNRMRDNSELIKELKYIVNVYKACYDVKLDKLKNEQQATLLQSKEHEDNYNQYQESEMQLEKTIASSESMTTYIKSEIQKEEKEQSALMIDTDLIVSENVIELQKENDKLIEKIGHEYDDIIKDYNKISNDLNSTKQELSAVVAMSNYFTEQLKNINEKEAVIKKDITRIEQLKKIYLISNIKDLLEVIYDNYKQTERSIITLESEEKSLNTFIENAKKGEYSFDEPMINKLRTYLNMHYKDCIIGGHEWVRGLDEPTRIKLTRKIPFIEYAFIVTKDFEKIGHDKVLSDFYRSAYIVPIVSADILDTVDEDINNEINTAHIAFAGKDLSFLYDKNRCEAQIKTAYEELEEVQLKLKKVKDNKNALWDDYTFVTKQIAISDISDIEKSEAINNRIKENEKKKLELEKRCESLLAVLESNQIQQNELKAKKEKLDKKSELIKSIILLNSSISEKYQRLEAEKNLQKDCKENLRQLKIDKDNQHKLIENNKIVLENIKDSILHLESVWESMRSYVTQTDYNNHEVIDVNKCDIAELESKYIAIKAALDGKNTDLADKEALANHYRQSMNKCKHSIEYRESSFDEIQEMFNAGNISVCSVSELENIKVKIKDVEKKINEIDLELDSQNALMNRLEGSIAHGVRQIEEKFGVFEKFACDNIDSFIAQHKEYIKELAENITKAEKQQKAIEKEMRHLMVIEKDLERIVEDIGMSIDINIQKLDTDNVYNKDNASIDISEYEAVQKEFNKLTKLEFKKQEEFNKNKTALIEKLEKIDGIELAQEIKVSVNLPKNENDTIELVERLKETNTFIQLEKDRVAKGIEDMEKIKANFENRCIQICSNVKTELDRLSKLSDITMDKEVISIIGLNIPYIKEEYYKQKMSEYIDATILTAEGLKDTQERLKYIRSRLAWKRLFSVIVTDMNSIRVNLYKRERIKDMSRYLRYEEAVGSTGQSQGIYIQFLIAIINYISSINAVGADSKILGKTIFIDNPFGAAKDIYIWEPIFKLLKTNHVQLIVPARGATPAITGRFDVNYILGQKLVSNKQQTVVIDYYSQADNEELEYTKMNYEQTTLKF